MADYKAYYFKKDDYIVDRFNLGKGDRLEYMRYHEPMGECGRHFVDVMDVDGEKRRVTRFFDPDEVAFYESEPL